MKRLICLIIGHNESKRRCEDGMMICLRCRKVLIGGYWNGLSEKERLLKFCEREINRCSK